MRNFSLEVAPGSLTALLGPSGCGKTTTLRLVAGLLQPDAGDVLLGAESLLRTAPERRPVGMVFQRPLLFPHLDVAANVGFGLRMRGVPRRERRVRVEELLDLVQLPGFGSRHPDELSGGQQQRVALARALVTSPEVLLLDEPFSQLDATLRGQMRDLLRDVQRRLGVTTLIVTHDQEEAVELADRIALMADGQLVQAGEPREFFEEPASVAVARFFRAGNILPGVSSDGCFRGALGEVRLPGGSVAARGHLVVRPESLVLSDRPVEGSLPGQVVSADYRGTHIDVLAVVGADQVRIRASAAADVRVGAGVHVQFPLRACRFLPDELPEDEGGSGAG